MNQFVCFFARRADCLDLLKTSRRETQLTIFESTSDQGSSHDRENGAEDESQHDQNDWGVSLRFLNFDALRGRPFLQMRQLLPRLFEILGAYLCALGQNVDSFLVRSEELAELVPVVLHPHSAVEIVLFVVGEFFAGSLSHGWLAVLFRLFFVWQVSFKLATSEKIGSSSARREGVLGWSAGCSGFYFFDLEITIP